MQRKLVSFWAALFVGIFSLAALLPVRAHADVNDFRFESFEADYYLSADSEGRSALRVTEKLTALFPTFNQNKGIMRAIPYAYDGHPASLAFDDASLTRNGRPEPVYSKEHSNGNLVIGTGTEQYVHGRQVYELSYTLRDVTKDFGSHQELYWDTNGTEWGQPFGSVVARVHLNEDLALAFTGETNCYQGRSGSNEACEATVGTSTGETVVTFRSTRPFSAGENLTLVMGFAPQTFEPHAPTMVGRLIKPLSILLMALSFVTIAAAIVLRFTKGKDAPGKGTIVPEYLPPKGLSVLQAAYLAAPGSRQAMAAQLVDLAVRHKLEIVETDKDRLLFGKKKVYKLKLIDSRGLNADESATLQLFFPGLPSGSEFSFDDTRRLQQIGIASAALLKKRKKQMRADGYRRKATDRWMALVLGSVVFVLALCLIIATASSGYAAGFAGAAIAASGFAFVFTLIITPKLDPLTEKGAEVRDYVKGLKLYISVAEEERLKLLQSVSGAGRRPLDTSDTAQVVKLYERVLPYAILLGQEKSWGKVLERYYDQTGTPAWYHGTTGFSAASFSSSLSSFSSSTSSSSSGLGGGGSSGGGGGGGGGGGR